MNTNQVTEFLNKFLPQHEILHCESEDQTVLDYHFQLAGVALKMDSGMEIFGASSARESSPLIYAAYECLERYVILNEAIPQDEDRSYKLSLSNGVALHDSWEKAHESALLELAERNEILKSWYCNTPVKLLSFKAQEHFSAQMEEQYEFVLVDFSTHPDYVVCGLFAFPKKANNNLIYGFGCARNVENAMQKAKKEFTTRLGFIWGESPDEEGHDRKSGLYHQDFYLVPENILHIREWLTGKTYKKHPCTKYQLTQIKAEDITPPAWLGRLSIVRVTSSDSIPLFFGEVPTELFDFSYRCDIPHPII